MKTGVTYDYDPESKTLTESTIPSSKGLTPRQRKITQKNREKDKSGSDPLYHPHHLKA